MWTILAISISSQCSTTGVKKRSRGVYYPVCVMVQYGAVPMLLITRNSPQSDGRGFPLSLSGPLSYVRGQITVNKMC